MMSEFERETMFATLCSSVGVNRRFNNVLWTHTADMVASKFYNT